MFLTKFSNYPGLGIREQHHPTPEGLEGRRMQDRLLRGGIQAKVSLSSSHW